jgi:hypothetical protein
VFIEVGFVLGEDGPQVAFVHDEDPVEELAAYAAHPPFHDRVHPWGLRSSEHHADTVGLEDLIEQRGEFAVPVPDQEFEVTGPIIQIEHQVASLLHDPGSRRVRRDTQHMDTTRGVLLWVPNTRPPVGNWGFLFGSGRCSRRAGSGVRIIKTPLRSPRANAFAERLVGTLRREWFDHLLIYGKRHLRAVLAEYERHYNDHRPHQGRSLRPPIHDPGEVIDMTARIHRRKTVTGLISEVLQSG